MIKGWKDGKRREKIDDNKKEKRNKKWYIACV